MNNNNIMSIEIIKEDYFDSFANFDEKALRWIFKNKKLLTQKFKQKYQRSPYDFVVQFKTKRGTRLVTDRCEIKKVTRVSYIKWSTVKKLGCPSSF